MADDAIAGVVLSLNLAANEVVDVGLEPQASVHDEINRIPPNSYCVGHVERLEWCVRLQRPIHSTLATELGVQEALGALR